MGQLVLPVLPFSSQILNNFKSISKELVHMKRDKFSLISQAFVYIFSPPNLISNFLFILFWGISFIILPLIKELN